MAKFKVGDLVQDLDNSSPLLVIAGSMNGEGTVRSRYAKAYQVPEDEVYLLSDGLFWLERHLISYIPTSPPDSPSVPLYTVPSIRQFTDEELEKETERRRYVLEAEGHLSYQERRLNRETEVLKKLESRIKVLKDALEDEDKNPSKMTRRR